MIEAVNSVLANAPLIKSSAVKDSQVQEAARSIVESVSSQPKAPYVSPYISMDVNLNKAVIQIRDAETGDVVETLSSPKNADQQRRSEATDDYSSNTPSVNTELLNAQETSQSESIHVDANGVAASFDSAGAGVEVSEVYSDKV